MSAKRNRGALVGGSIGAAVGVYRSQKGGGEMGLVGSVSQGIAIAGTAAHFQKKETFAGAAISGATAGAVILTTQLLGKLVLAASMGGGDAVREIYVATDDAKKDDSLVKTAVIQAVKAVAFGAVYGAGLGIVTHATKKLKEIQ